MIQISKEVIDGWFDLGCKEGKEKEPRRTCFSCTEAEIAYFRGYDASCGTFTPSEPHNEPL
ncbi:hypothetical protein LCGC14_3004720 [marine sediment metagenome]|uniref:Uncharacterized protein n=1 Tax=marine sediment metagenome TaxID=412755 RepID=A0A0F8Z7N3_9ZZZZ